MNKLGIWAIAIAGAFLIGVVSANPVTEAVGGWQLAFEGLDTRITTLEGDVADPEVRLSELEEIVFKLPIRIDSQAGVNVNKFWGLDQQTKDDFFSVVPAIIPSGTITGFDLETISPDTLPVNARLYLDGSPTSLVCTVPVGQLSCSATGSVVVTGLTEAAMRNEGPVGMEGLNGILRDPSVLLAFAVG